MDVLDDDLGSDDAGRALRHAIKAERELLKARAALSNHPLWEQAADVAAAATALVGKLNAAPRR